MLKKNTEKYTQLNKTICSQSPWKHQEIQYKNSRCSLTKTFCLPFISSCCLLGKAQRYNLYKQVLFHSNPRPAAAADQSGGLYWLTFQRIIRPDFLDSCSSLFHNLCDLKTGSYKSHPMNHRWMCSKQRCVPQEAPLTYQWGRKLKS